MVLSVGVLLSSGCATIIQTCRMQSNYPYAPEIVGSRDRGGPVNRMALFVLEYPSDNVGYYTRVDTSTKPMQASPWPLMLWVSTLGWVLPAPGNILESGRVGWVTQPRSPLAESVASEFQNLGRHHGVTVEYPAVSRPAVAESIAELARAYGDRADAICVMRFCRAICGARPAAAVQRGHEIIPVSAASPGVLTVRTDGVVVSCKDSRPLVRFAGTWSLGERYLGPLSADDRQASEDALRDMVTRVITEVVR
jgi:hypothetical protein